MFSKSCTYGIKAVVYIAKQSLDGERVKLGDVAKNTGSPEAFTAKILSTLTKHGVVDSYKGPYGGFNIDINRMKQLKLSHIVFAIDGDSIYEGCVLGLNECNAAEPCPMHEHFVKIRKELRTTLTTTTIYDLAKNFKSGETILLR